MKNISMKMMVVIAAISALGLIAGCGGGGGGSGASAAPATGTNSGAAPSAPPEGVSPEAAALYAANCADCHGALATSEKIGTTLPRLQNAIVNNVGGGMGFRAGLTAAEQQTIVAALTPATTTPPSPTDGAALYAANCAGCHGTLANSGKKGTTSARLQSAIAGNVGNMGFLSSLTATEQQAIVAVLATTTPPPTTPPPPTTSTDGAALYASNCASCHGALATSAKKGATAAQIQVRMDAPPYVANALTAAQVQAIASALAVTTPPTTPPPPTTSTDGAALYAANCASCHGALANSAKRNATAAQIQTRMAAPPYVATALTTAQVQAIATALVSTTTTPPPAATCGSCHALPPANGKHSKHASKGVACATCHGSGFSTTTVNAALHNNGIKNLTSTIGWTSSSRSCANSCHGTERW